MAGSSSSDGVATCTMYGNTCPLAYDCKKGGHYFKASSPKRALAMISNHLKTSTYHHNKITSEQVDALMESM